MKFDLIKYQQELSSELENILDYWKTFAIDEVNGGFIGKIDNDNCIDYNAPKGSVLNARILWSFSAAFNLKQDIAYLSMANRAFEYIVKYFVDIEFGGVYWLLDAKGKPLDTKKQVYAIAFTIYAFSEYFIAVKDEFVKEKAIELYKHLVDYSYDPENGGYFEAFSREWKSLDDLRLSEKDANEKKTMNTHLHVLEAFTTLYEIWPDEGLKQKIIGLIDNFTSYIISGKTGNLILFFDEKWSPKSDIISYGHDIEAAWLLLEAAEATGEQALIESVKLVSLRLAEVSKNGIDTDGGLWYEYEPSHNHIIKQKHWWVQAEAMVGFFNAWQISKDEQFLTLGKQAWDFIKDKIIDYNHGEWFWGIFQNGEIMKAEDKVGIWKCPYHNSRACIELIKRIA